MPAIQSVVRALRVLRAINRSPQGKGLSEVCREQGLHKTTALRVLRTLVSLGMVLRDEETGVYAADAGFWLRVSPFIRPALAFISDAQSVLDQTARREGTTVVVLLPDENRRRIEVPLYGLPPVPVRIEPRHGGGVSLHATAGGQCYLAYAPEDELQEYIAAGLAGGVVDGDESARRLREKLAAVRRDGYALNRGGDAGVSTSVSVPLQTADGGVYGGLSLVLVGAEPDEDALKARVPALLEASGKVSSLLGYESFRRYMEEAESDAPAPPTEDAGEPTEARSTGPEVTRSVGRAFRLMATLWDLRDGATAGELARRRGLSRATTYRLLQSLLSERMVRRNGETGRYEVDPVLWLRLAPLLLQTTSVDRLLSQVLERVARVAGATVYLVHPDSGRRKAVLAAHALPRRSLAVHPEPTVFPMLHTVAAGKCLLAAQSEVELAAYIRSGLEATTADTITSPAELTDEIREVRASGYAVSRGEVIPDVGGVAVPVRDRKGEVVGALAVVPLVSEMSEHRVPKWVEQLQMGARAVSRVLGLAQTVQQHGNRVRRGQECSHSGTEVVLPQIAGYSESDVRPR